MRVPFLDLSAHHAPLRSEIDAAIGQVIDSGAFAGGPFVAGFEESSPHIAVANMPSVSEAARMRFGWRFSHSALGREMK